MTDQLDPARLRELHDVLRDNPFTMEFARTGYVYNPHERELTRYLIKHRADILAMADENAALKAEVARLREVVGEIRDLPGEINPSNYDHDDACELNRQFCYAISVASAALAGGDHD